jgi:alkylation response protein AidB-like acyl-CoA dehydrogenase
MTTPLLECATADEVDAAVTAWAADNIPIRWREAALAGGPAAMRTARTADEYRAWYPVFARSGLAVAGWPADCGGLGWERRLVKAGEQALAAYHLPRLNPLGLNLAAPALFSYGTEEQRRRHLPPMVANERVWCQLFSEPGAGSDLASLACRAEREGDGWRITGQKVWTTWAHHADWGVLLARTDPDVPKRDGITYFLIDMHQPGVDVRPLKHIGGEIDFNEVFLDEAYVSDDDRVGAVGEGWRVGRATLSGERQMVSGAGSGGVDRIGGSGADRLISLARQRMSDGHRGGWSDPLMREAIVRVWALERIRSWTNVRIKAGLRAGLPLGPESSIGKVQGAEHNQRMQMLATQVLGLDAVAWDGDPGSYSEAMPPEVRGMLRSRANSIEGGTSEVNRTIIAERVLGLPKEPDPTEGLPWREVPRG